jgi:hypothetical protein
MTTLTEKSSVLGGGFVSTVSEDPVPRVLK